MKTIILTLALLAATPALADTLTRDQLDNCGTFTSLDRPTQAMLAHAYLSGVFEASAPDSNAGAMASVLISSPDRHARTMEFARLAAKLCYAKLALEDTGDVYSVMSEVLVDMVLQVLAEIERQEHEQLEQEYGQ